MTDKQIIKPRPICLYQDTCLFLKEKTRVCEDCVHHKNYWSELLARDQAEKIKSLEQEAETLKAGGIISKYKQTLTEIKEIAKKTLNMVDYKTYFKRDNKSLKQEGFKALNEILQKISEVVK